MQQQIDFHCCRQNKLTFFLSLVAVSTCAGHSNERPHSSDCSINLLIEKYKTIKGRSVVTGGDRIGSSVMPSSVAKADGLMVLNKTESTGTTSTTADDAKIPSPHEYNKSGVKPAYTLEEELGALDMFTVDLDHLNLDMIICDDDDGMTTTAPVAPAVAKFDDDSSSKGMTKGTL